MLRALPLVLATALVPGCYLSHAREDRPVPPPRVDGGVFDASEHDTGVDAGPLSDSGASEGDYWSLERRSAQLTIQHELGCTQHEGGRIALRVTTLIENTCEHGGPVEIAEDEDGVLVVTAHVWVHHRRDPDTCLGVTAISERTVLRPAFEGTFRAANEDGTSSVEYRASAIDGLPCSFDGVRDAPCMLDCQCQEPFVCIPQLGDFVACDGGHCGDPCDSPSSGVTPVYGAHLECDASEQCRSGVAGGAPSCQPIVGDGCQADGATCGSGLVCPATGAASECVWEVRLTGSNRIPCRGDDDCATGLLCVEQPSGRRRCDVPCFTNEMRCPDMHDCSAGPWVCEWLGE